MSLAAGSRLGPYEILAPIGAGGMGEVYQARDTKLKRDVALKVLPEAFARDPDRMTRFQREAEVLASLNHPNIAAIYGIEESDRTRALVMELVEGVTLAERLKQGAIPLMEALHISAQIVDALEYAHEKNVVHRDLKPANVKLTPEGVVKLLDFGLAKAIEDPVAPSAPENSPTLTIRGTQIGLILGTASYMSPEQASGKVADRRADIWSFGVVLWEMLTGKRLFEGETISHTLADVLRAEIDFDKLTHGTPPAIRELLRRCLDRAVKNRLRDIGEARVAIQKYLANPVSAPESGGAASAKSRLAIGMSIATGMLLVALGVLAFVHFRERPPASEVVRLQFALPEKTTVGQNLAVSPDGKRVAFLALGADGIQRVWIRSLDSLDSQPLPGTEGANLGVSPFWSWDSRFVVFEVGGFGVGGKLKKIEASGGPPQTLCDIPGSLLGGFWTRQGRIVFGTGGSGLLQVASGGGAVSAVTTLNRDRQERFHAFPTMLPDGRHFVYLVAGSTESGVYLSSLDAKPAQRDKRLLADPSAAFYVPSLDLGAAPGSGYMLFVRENTLMAQPFDAGRAEPTGDAIPVAREIANAGAFGVSANGVLVYRTAGPENHQLTWFDRQGKALGPAGPPGLYNFLALSQDGTRAAVQRFERSGQGDIWLIDIARGGLVTRFTVDQADDAAPIWSPDGSRIVWASNRDGPYNLYQKPATGGNEVALLNSTLRKVPYDWSSDGRFLLYGNTDQKAHTHLWVLPMIGEPKPWVLMQTEFTQTQGQFSPDMHWVAYQSDESGRFEIYVRPFPPSSSSQGVVTVSNGGGYQPHWRRKDGKELFFFTGDGKLMAADVTPGPVLKVGTPHILFSAPIYGGGSASEVHRWDVTADGQKFLINTVPGQSNSAFTVMLNWQAGLKR